MLFGFLTPRCHQSGIRVVKRGAPGEKGLEVGGLGHMLSISGWKDRAEHVYSEVPLCTPFHLMVSSKTDLGSW